MRLPFLPPLGQEIADFWSRYQSDLSLEGGSFVSTLPFQIGVDEPLAVASAVLNALNTQLFVEALPAALPSQAGQVVSQALRSLGIASGEGLGTITTTGLMSVGAGSTPSRPPSSNAPASNQLLVQWDPAATPEQRDAALARMGGSRLETIHTGAMQLFGQGVLEVIELPPGMSVEQGMQLYVNRPGVVVAEPNFILGVDAVSNDPGYTGGSLWGMYSADNPTVAGPTNTTNRYGVQAEQAWAQGYVGTTGTVMGVIDTGIDYTHPDLYLNIWLNQGEIRNLGFFSQLLDGDSDGMITFWDLNAQWNQYRAQNPQLTVPAWLNDWNANGRIDAGDLLDNRSGWEDGLDNDGNGYNDDLIGWDFVNNDNDPYDDNSHGTHCAGTIGAMGGNATGVAGVAWTTLLMPLKFLSGSGSGSTAGAIKAVDYYTYATSQWDSSYNAASAVSYVGTSNSWGGGGYSSTLYTAIVNGAKVGNLFVAAAGNSAANNDSTANYPSNYSTLSAMGWEAVVAVASITNTGALSSFSSYGATTVDLGAPGSSIYSTVPGGGYGTKSGTSMATPHVAGALVLLAAAYPTATPQQLLQALYSGTAATTSLSGRTVTGGRLDVMSSLNWLAANLSGGGGGGAGGTNQDQPLVLWGTTASDVITGASKDDQLAGVPASGISASALGKGQVDTLTGGDGADLFLLADARGTFYNDGNSRNYGKNDYALIRDFSASQGDVLQLESGRQHLWRNTTINGVAYTEIYLGNGDSSFSSADELIARLEGQSLASGSSIGKGVFLLGSQVWTSYA